MGDVCGRVINIRRQECGRPAVAVVYPPAGLPDEPPLPVCAGHLVEHRRCGDHIEEIKEQTGA